MRPQGTGRRIDCLGQKMFYQRGQQLGTLKEAQMPTRGNCR